MKAVIKKSDMEAIKNLLEKNYSEPEKTEICKSLDELNEDLIEKANNYGRKIPIKKMTADGRQITYWINPEDLNQGKMKGQQNLFDDEEMNRLDNQQAGEDDYYNNWDSETYELRIKPLVREMEKVEKNFPGLSKRINQKYASYTWDRDTRDLDIELDFDTLEFLKKSTSDPENKDYYQQEFNEKTQRLCKKLNNRKREMARLKVNSPVTFKGEAAKIVSFNDRGYPVIQLKSGKKVRCFVDEIVNIDELIEKYGKSA